MRATKRQAATMPVITICDEDPVLRLAAIALRGLSGDDGEWLSRYFAPEPVDPEALTVMATRHGLAGAEVRALSSDQERDLVRHSADSTALLCRRATISSEIMAASPFLKRIVRLGADPSGIDLDTAAARGVTVACLVRPSLAYTAEHAVLLMLAATKDLVTADRLARDPHWDRQGVFPRDGVAYNWPAMAGLGGLYGMTIGLIGLGQVGLLVAERLRPFGVSLLYTKPHQLSFEREAELGLSYVTQEALLARADLVSLHARWTQETTGMMNAEAFAAMKPRAIFVNTSRGALVDEAALAAALHAGHLGFAALDTHAPEPRDTASPLSRAPRTIFTPHIAGGSRSALLGEVEAMVAALGESAVGR